MNDCIFCKIVTDTIPSTKIYEDEEFLAFLDIRPIAPGHTLVIPKKHCRWVWDVPNDSEYFAVVKKIAHAQRKAFATDAIYSKVIGEEVPHAHVWLYPNPDDAKDEKNNFAENAEKIKNALA